MTLWLWVQGRAERAAAMETAELLQRVEHLGYSIYRLRADQASLLRLFYGKQEEVDRLTSQLEACQTLLLEQKRGDCLDRNSIASIANTIGLIVNTAMMAWTMTHQLGIDVQEAAVEVQVVCQAESSDIDQDGPGAHGNPTDPRSS